MIDRPLTLVGAPGSPYSRKLRAVMRYRRIPYAWVHHGSPEARVLPRPRVALLPYLVLPGAGGQLEAAVDSTPLIRRLETLHSGRSVIPPDPALAFLDALLEDYADEWLTNEARAALEGRDGRLIDAVLSMTGCDRLFPN